VLRRTYQALPGPPRTGKTWLVVHRDPSETPKHMIPAAARLGGGNRRGPERGRRCHSERPYGLFYGRRPALIQQHPPWPFDNWPGTYTPTTDATDATVRA
jgi:hypothetical protein